MASRILSGKSRFTPAPADHRKLQQQIDSIFAAAHAKAMAQMRDVLIRRERELHEALEPGPCESFIEEIIALVSRAMAPGLPTSGYPWR